MAVVRKLKREPLQRESKHTEVDCTYCVVSSPEGRFLQVDTYGSNERQERGKKSQSIRFSPEAIAQLRQILASEL